MTERSKRKEKNKKGEGQQHASFTHVTLRDERNICRHRQFLSRNQLKYLKKRIRDAVMGGHVSVSTHPSVLRTRDREIIYGICMCMSMSNSVIPARTAANALGAPSGFDLQGRFVAAAADAPLGPVGVAADCLDLPVEVPTILVWLGQRILAMDSGYAADIAGRDSDSDRTAADSTYPTTREGWDRRYDC
jgi:hypothetical protein